MTPTAKLYSFPTKKAAPVKVPLTVPERAALKTLDAAIAPFVTIGNPDFLDELEAMLSKHTVRARQLAIVRRNAKE